MMLSLRHLRGGIMYKDWASQLGSPLLHRDAYFSICTIFYLIKYANYHYTLNYLLTVPSKIRRNKRFGVHVFLHTILRFNSLSQQRFTSQKSD